MSDSDAADPPAGFYTCGRCWGVFPERQLNGHGIHRCEACGLETTLVTRIEITVNLADGTTGYFVVDPSGMWSKAGGPPPWATLGRALHQMAAAADLPSLPADGPEHGGGSHAVG